MSSLISIILAGEPAVRGYFAVDAAVNGRSYGGVRIDRDITPETIQRIARAKTLKYGFLGLPVGGAKMGICADPYMPVESKREILRKFGEAIKPHLKTKSFVPCEDIGTTKDDIKHILISNGVKVMPRTLTDASFNYTGTTVYIAAVRAASQVGLDMSRASVAVEGFGSVGSSAALAFWKGGIRVVAVSTIYGVLYNDAGLDISEMIKLRDTAGDRVVEVYPGGKKMRGVNLAEMDADIFSPCAQPDAITADNARRVRARIVCPGANCPVTPEAEEILFEMGVLSVPDILANCGGVLGASMRRAGVKEESMEHYLSEVVGGQIGQLLAAAIKENKVPAFLAERIARKRFDKAKAEAESKGIRGRIFKTGLELYRKGIIPQRLVQPIAPRYFHNKFASVESLSEFNHD